MNLAALLGRKTVGDNAERVAENFLCSQGLTTTVRNFRCRSGEIDLIMQDGDVTVFVEVRYRASEQFGGAAASINLAKQRRLATAAEQYLSKFRQPPPCRFDAILMRTTDANGIEWVRNAFGI